MNRRYLFQQFIDERLRQAVSMAWDRDLFLDTFLNVAKFKTQGIDVETRWNSHLAATNEGWWLDPKSKDFGQAMELQTEHARKQMDSFVHQLEEIRDLAAQVIQDSTPPGMPGVGKP